MKALTAEKEAQLTQMLSGNDVENISQILAMDGPTLKEYTDMPGYWAKMVKDAAQALEDATEDEASEASGAKQLNSQPEKKCGQETFGAVGGGCGVRRRGGHQDRGN